MLKEVRATFVRNATCFEPPQWRVCSHFTIAELVVVFFSRNVDASATWLMFRRIKALAGWHAVYTFFYTGLKRLGP